MDRYFILWVRIRYCCDLTFCSNCPNLGHWDLFQVDSHAFLISPYPVCLFSSFPSILLRAGPPPVNVTYGFTWAYKLVPAFLKMARVVLVEWATF